MVMSELEGNSEINVHRSDIPSVYFLLRQYRVWQCSNALSGNRSTPLKIRITGQWGGTRILYCGVGNPHSRNELKRPHHYNDICNPTRLSHHGIIYVCRLPVSYPCNTNQGYPSADGRRKSLGRGGIILVGIGSYWGGYEGINLFL